jgi:phosphoglycolate phosphatase
MTPHNIDIKQISAVLFDKDGTLFDFQRTWSAWALDMITTLAHGPEGREALAQGLGFDLPGQRFLPHSPVIAGTADEVAMLLAELLPSYPGGAPALAQTVATAAARAPLAEAVALGPLLQHLRGGGLALGVATNDNEAVARKHLAAHLELFDFIAGFDSGHGAKPQPGMLLAFARQMDLPPSRVLMVGDSRHDLIAAAAAGMPSVAVLTGVAAAPELAPHATAVFPDIGHLPAFLGL